MKTSQHKNQLLFKCICYDLIGMASYIVPVVGPLLDVVWAPIAARQMYKLFPNRKGKIAAAVVFVEEILPLDIIPTFTLMWLLTYAFNRQKAVVNFG